MESYLQKAWGESIDNVNLDDVKLAIQETIAMDQEHGAFWVGLVEDEENVLETNQSLSVTAVFADGCILKKQFGNWGEIERLYKTFLTGDFDTVKTIMITL